MQILFDQLEKLVRGLESEFPKPDSVSFDGRSAYRHAPDDRSDILASFLKAVRIVSLLNASLCLLEKGFSHEVMILCRAIYEATEDIDFFLLNIGETGPSDKQKQHLEEFYQEQYEDPKDFSSLKRRKRVLTRNIRSAICNNIGSGDSSTLIKGEKHIYATLSAFVHGAYFFLMELYGGSPCKISHERRSGTASYVWLDWNF